MATKKYVTQKQRTIRVIVAGLLAVVILSAAFIVGGVLYSNTRSSGSSMRKQIPLESENYKVDNCMMTYYFLSDFYNFYNQNGMYLQYMGLDTTKSLKEQSYDEQSTWFDYFVSTSLNNANGYLLYAEEAKAQGFELADLDSRVDEEIKKLEENAKSLNIDLEQYLTNIFNIGVKEKDVRRALELQIYATEYYNKVENDYSASITDEQFEKYYTDNKNSLDKVDYLAYTIKADVATDADEATKSAAYSEAQATADSLKAAATSKDAFISWVKAHLIEANDALETPLTEDEINTKAETVTKAQAYTEGSDLSTWAFAAERKVGDVTLIDDGAGSYTVYMMDKTAYRIEDITRDVRHILIRTGDGAMSDADAKAKADEILATYLAGDKTAESFDALAKEHNQDANSLYEKVIKGQMVAEFDNWLFDEARAEGDTDVVKTQYGYHVMYFVGEGRAQWQNDAYNTMLQTYITETVTAWSETYKIDVDYEAAAAIPDTIPQTAFAAPETEAPADTAEATDTEATADTAEVTDTEAPADTAEVTDTEAPAEQ